MLEPFITKDFLELYIYTIYTVVKFLQHTIPRKGEEHVWIILISIMLCQCDSCYILIKMNQYHSIFFEKNLRFFYLFWLDIGGKLPLSSFSFVFSFVLKSLIWSLSSVVPTALIYESIWEVDEFFNIQKVRILFFVDFFL